MVGSATRTWHATFRLGAEVMVTGNRGLLQDGSFPRGAARGAARGREGAFVSHKTTDACLDDYCSNGYYFRMTSVTARAGTGSRRFDSREQEAFLGLWRTYDRLRALEEELFAGHGLTPQQYNALRLLGSEHPRTLATLELAGRLVSRAPDITRLLDRLDERGLIER